MLKSSLIRRQLFNFLRILLLYKKRFHMPLRAILNGNSIQSFDFNESSWSSLKENYKKETLVMSCCGNKAIPKISKLGTQYFAHARRNDCTSVNETKEHLQLKAIVAQIATKEGWKVITEKKGENSDGEVWIADVFCSKGRAKLAFEIQWSYQAEEEYQRRTNKYDKSGVRCAWLYRIISNKNEELSDSRHMPCFGFKVDGNEYFIPRFNIDIESFVRGMLQRKLSWTPEEGEELVAYAYYNDSHCLKCGKVNNYFCAMDVYLKNGTHLEGYLYYNYYGSQSAKELIKRYIAKETLEKHAIGSLDHIYNKSGDYAYMSHGCLYCNGVHCNHTERYDYHNNKSQAIRFVFPFDSNLLDLSQRWCFNGR